MPMFFIALQTKVLSIEENTPLSKVCGSHSPAVLAPTSVLLLLS